MKITNITEGKSDKNGNPTKLITLEGRDKAVMVFSFHSKFNSFSEGDEIELEQNGEYWNIADPDKPQSTGGGSGAQTRKTEAIGKAMDKKEESIKISSTARDATLISIHLGTKLDVSAEDFKEQWTYWRTWLLKNWDVDEPFH